MSSQDLCICDHHEAYHLAGTCVAYVLNLSDIPCHCTKYTPVPTRPLEEIRAEFWEEFNE